jgi:hypothetical protein
MLTTPQVLVEQVAAERALVMRGRQTPVAVVAVALEVVD